MNKETFVLLVNSEYDVVGFRKHLILLVNDVIPDFLHPLQYLFWPRARARGGIPPRDCRNTGITEFTSKRRCFRKPTTEFTEFTGKTSVSLFMSSPNTFLIVNSVVGLRKHIFTCEFCDSGVFTSVAILFVATRARGGIPFEMAETQESQNSLVK